MRERLAERGLSVPGVPGVCRRGRARESAHSRGRRAAGRGLRGEDGRPHPEAVLPRSGEAAHQLHPAGPGEVTGAGPRSPEPGPTPAGAAGTGLGSRLSSAQGPGTRLLRPPRGAAGRASPGVPGARCRRACVRPSAQDAPPVPWAGTFLVLFFLLGDRPGLIPGSREQGRVDSRLSIAGREWRVRSRPTTLEKRLNLLVPETVGSVRKAPGDVVRGEGGTCCLCCDVCDRAEVRLEAL